MYNDPYETVQSFTCFLISCGWGIDFARQWMKAPNPQWDNKSPEDIIKEGQEDVVIRFLKTKGMNLHAYS